MSACLLLLAAFAVARAGAPGPFLSLLLVAAVGLGLLYLPKYLHLTLDEGKKYAWTLRVRWVAAALFALLGVALALLQGALLPLLAAAWLALSNGLAARSRKREAAAARLPLFFFSSDALLIALLFHLGLGPELTAAAAALAAHLALVAGYRESRWFDAAVSVTALFITLAACALHGVHLLPCAALFHLVLAAVLATIFLRRSARRHHQQSAAALVQELCEFTGAPPEDVRHALLTSNRTLAENWLQSNPDPGDKAALARWYAQNSIHYLYAATGFNLQYKQIAFVLDVLRLSAGRCLDYGAGAGLLAMELARRGCAATYYDVEGETMRFARWRARREGLTLDFHSRKDALTGGFDTVMSLDVLEHLPDLPGELDFLAGLLRPGGRIIFNVPAGATERHPMHLSHELDVPRFLRQKGLRDAKGFRLRWLASENMRKAGVCVFLRPPGGPAENLESAARLGESNISASK